MKDKEERDRRVSDCNACLNACDERERREKEWEAWDCRAALRKAQSSQWGAQSKDCPLEETALSKDG